MASHGEQNSLRVHTSENVLPVLRGIVLAILVSASKTFGAVGNLKTTVAGTLESGEQASTSCSALQTNVQDGVEGARAIVNGGNIEVGTISLCSTRVRLIKTELVEDTASDKKASGIGCSVVGQPNLPGKPIINKLARLGGANDVVTRDRSVRDLAQDVLVALRN